MKLLTVSALLCAVMALTTAAACPKDWTPFNNNCYIYEPKSITFLEAERNCQSKGAKLATVQSDEEREFIGKIVSEGFGVKNPYIWIDGSGSLQDIWNLKNVCPGTPRKTPFCPKMHLGARCLGFSSCGAVLQSVCIKKP